MAESHRLSFSTLKSPAGRFWLQLLFPALYLALVAAALVYAPFEAARILEFAATSAPFYLVPGFMVPYAIALVYLTCAAWVLWSLRQYAHGRALAALLGSVALALAGVYPSLTGHTSVYLLPGAGMAAAALAALALLYSRNDPLQARPPRLRFTIYAVGVAYALLAALLPIFQPLSPPNQPLELAVVLTAGAAGIFMAFRLRDWLPAAPPVERDRVRLLLAAALLTVVPPPVLLVIGLPLASFFFLVIFPLAAAYTARKENLARVRVVGSRVMLYGVITLLVVGGYALLVSGLALIFTGFSPQTSPLVSGVIFFVLALLLLPLRSRLQDHLDSLFFRGERAYQDRLESFSSKLTDLVDLPAIIRALRQYTETSLFPGRLVIFLYSANADQYMAVPDENGRLPTDLRFAPGSPLVELLRKQSGSLVLTRLDRLPPVLIPDEARIRLLDALVYVPLAGQQRLAGWVALAPRSSGEAYTARELNFLDALCDQAAVAIERAQVAARMENRAREMAVLSRLAQGINVTISYDDILELIFAQCGQVIPMTDFQLLLSDPETGMLSPAFWVERDERLTERENKPLPAAPSLEQEVIRLRKPLLTADYPGECEKNGVVPRAKEITAWMCVPLNAGAETIGVLAAGSRDPAAVYVAEQLNLLQSVADQAAGAIVKTRLLNEAQRRARQLASLNEVTRKLTSTLDLEPLLQTILNSAVDILNCDAGSLLMTDAQTDELVFEVVVSPVAKDLLKRRMPAGSGLVGKAVKTRQPVLVNNVQDAPEWFPNTDRQTGFVTQAVLVVPLEIKDRIIGVIEVINRKDGLPFGKDDESLLLAFAAQAAVAIENARLYTNTDQALAARVEELSVMQRIDRELNASLDTSKAVGITLEWAMRQSGAAAGLVGIVQENGLRVMAAQGYGTELAAYTEQLLPLETLDLQEVIDSGAARQRILPEGGKGGLLAAARSQAVLALQSEERVIGILLLESAQTERIPEDVLAFLARLADHASIAISNAQLYTAVQAANIAKSEFVSFVSHELKNPMTSVKGFTELLASGVVGPINEAQANFLNTIRSNVDRMNTLVSDLNDVSKIEANRLRLDFRAFPLADAVEEVARSTKRQLDDKEQTLVLQPLSELPNLWADRTRVVQVLVNLVSNANKYTDRGGTVTLGAEACENQWNPQGAPRVVHIWVQDNGIGINEADQKKIFTKFFRSDDPKTREATGTGLGLNITKSLVEMQGGTIWFESEFRKGTIFHFTVPIAE